MTDCNGCGACCDPVVLPFSPAQLEMGTVARVFGERVGRWARTQLTPVLPRRRGLQRAPWTSGMSEIILDGKPMIMLGWFYDCAWYDRESRRCTHWSERPDVCSGYPWYGDAPDRAKVIPPTCSYRADIGLPVHESRDVRVDVPRRRRATP